MFTPVADETTTFISIPFKCTGGSSKRRAFKLLVEIRIHFETADFVHLSRNTGEIFLDKTRNMCLVKLLIRILTF